MNFSIPRRCGRAAALGLGMLVLLAPRAGQAGGRDKDWAEILARANEQITELEAHPCAQETVKSTEIHDRAAANLRLASFLDFAARNFPEKPAAARADKIYPLLYRAVSAYRRAYACVPGFENRGTLEFAIDLIEYAVADLRAHPSEGQEAAIAEYMQLRTEVSASQPVAPTPESCPRRAPCGGEEPDPSGAGRRGCSLDTDRPGLAGTVALLALCMGAANHRRRARRLACGPA